MLFKIVSGRNNVFEMFAQEAEEQGWAPKFETFCVDSEENCYMVFVK